MTIGKGLVAAGLTGLITFTFGPATALAQDAECVAAFRIDGHRGTGANDRGNPFAENTLASFQQAFAEGADVVELDVRFSGDETLVVLHDDEVDDTTDGTGCVNGLSDEELAALDAGLPDMPAGVPTLAGVLAAVDGDLNLDVKVTESSRCAVDDPADLAAAVKTAIDADPAPDRTVVVSSFSLAFLTELRALDADLELSLLTLSVPAVEELTTAGLSGVNMLFGDPALESVPMFQEAGLRTAVWTINDTDDIQDALAAGVDVIITDEPDVAVAERADFCTVPDEPPTDDGGDSPTDDGNGDDGGCSVAAANAPGTWLLGLAALIALARRRRITPAD